MHAMLQQDQPDDYVLATGATTSVRDFAAMAFAEVGIEVAWQGAGVDEIGVNSADGAVLVRVDPAFYRPKDVECLIGDASKAQRVLGWEPKVGLNELVAEMVQAEIESSA
jgi:GDPmannose 4,6-dehydratase